MILIVGLGNPGEKYESTRHNLGFVVVEELARKLLPLAKTKWRKSEKFNSEFLIYPDLIGVNSQFLLAKPQTFMNASGFAVAKLAAFYKVKPRDIWVVHDDVDLAFGHLRIRLGGGGAAGHHGVESIIKELGTDRFIRFRLGISHPGRGSDAQVERYVLQKFASHQKSELKHLLKKANAALKMALEKGLEKAANRYSQ